MTIEEHPLEPFLPANARVLFLGSFPPGGKASEELQAYFAKKGIEVKIPKVGESRPLRLPLEGRESITWWRMPSSSRAYPMKLEKKTEYYSRLFEYLCCNSDE